MSTGAGPGVPELSPQDSWDVLAENDDAVLVDVRTRPEWAFVGLPSLEALGRRLILAEWRHFPDMALNTSFAEALQEECGGRLSATMLFMCRSGARSLEAARHVSAWARAHGQDVKCINVAEGFEGDLNEDRHRGEANGWKARGLPWRQT